MRHQFVEELRFGVGGVIDDVRGALQPVKLFIQIVFSVFAGAFVPVRPYFAAAFDRQETQKIALSLHTQKIHIQTRFELMPDISEDIESGHQQVVDTFEQWIIDDPPGFGYFADKPVDDAGAVKMPENRQQDIGIDPVAVPDIVDVIAGAVRVQFRQILFLGPSGILSEGRHSGARCLTTAACSFFRRGCSTDR